MNFKKNASYGYSVMFYAYVEGDKPSVWMERLEANTTLEMAIYTNASTYVKHRY